MDTYLLPCLDLCMQTEMLHGSPAVGHRVRALRKERGLTIRQVSTRHDFYDVTLHAIEKGLPVTRATLERLAIVFETSFHDLTC